MLYQQRVRQEVDKLMTEVVVRLPRVMKWVATVTPGSVQRAALARSLNYALRNTLATDELAFFQGKVLNIEIADIGAEFSIRYKNSQLIVTEKVANADLRFSASSYDVLLIATQRLDPDMLFFQRRLEMNGDTELGLGIKNLLASIELDQQLNARLAQVLQRCAGIIERYRE